MAHTARLRSTYLAIVASSVLTMPPAPVAGQATTAAGQSEDDSRGERAENVLLYDALSNRLTINQPTGPTFDRREHPFTAGQPVVLEIRNARLNAGFSIRLGETELPLALPGVVGIDSAELLAAGATERPPETLGFRAITELAVEPFSIAGVLDSLADPRRAHELEVHVRRQYNELVDGYRSLRTDIEPVIRAVDAILGAASADTSAVSCPVFGQGGDMTELLQGLVCLGRFVDPIATRASNPDTTGTLADREFRTITEELDLLLGSVMRLNRAIDDADIVASLNGLIDQIEEWQRKARVFLDNDRILSLARDVYALAEGVFFEMSLAEFAVVDRLGQEYADVVSSETLLRAIDEYARSLEAGASEQGDLIDEIVDASTTLAQKLEEEAPCHADALEMLEGTEDRDARYRDALSCAFEALRDRATRFSEGLATTNGLVSRLIGMANRIYLNLRSSDRQIVPLGTWNGNYLVRFQIVERPMFVPYQLAAKARPISGAEAVAEPQAPDVVVEPILSSDDPEGASSLLYSDVFEVHKTFRFGVMIGGGLSWLPEKEGVDSTRVAPTGADTDFADRPQPLLFLAVKVYFSERNLFPGVSPRHPLLPGAVFVGPSLNATGEFVAGLAWEPVAGLDFGAGIHWGRRNIVQLGPGTGDSGEAIEVGIDDGRGVMPFVFAGLNLNIFRKVFGGTPSLPYQ